MRQAEQPLTKITLNLFTKDLEELKRIEGSGYQIKIRDLVHEYLRKHKQKVENIRKDMLNASS